MARSNTPSAYKCGSCGAIGHNARTCPQKQGSKSVSLLLKEQRAERRVLREARKAEKLAKKQARSSPAAIQKEIEQVIAASKPVFVEAVDSTLPIVDIPPTISKFGDTTYVVSGSVRVPVPDDTQLSDVAAFVQYVPRVSSNQLTIFKSR